MRATAIGFYSSPYCSEAQALFTRMTVQPSTKLKALINTTIVNLKATGIWTKADIIRFMRIDTSAHALLNWKKNANNALAVNSPIFTAYSGFRSASSTGGYLNSNYNMYSEAVNLALENASIVYGLTDYNIAANDYYIAGAYPNAAPYFIFRPYRSNTTASIYFLSTGISSVTSPVVNSLHHLRRQNSAQASYKKGTGAFSTFTSPEGVTLPNLQVYELAANGNNVPQGRPFYEEDFAYYGAALSDTEAANLQTIYAYWNANVAATA
jgi:hypothetical protein